MKLIIQIPCLNEEATLPATIAAIPRKIDGFDSVEIMVIDDGSTDRTVEVARSLGVDHIVTLTRNRGLAGAFSAGLDACLKAGADVIVNTDGDNQYAGTDIPTLVKPILNGVADIVIGDRQTSKISHFSPTKKFLQFFGSAVVRRLADCEIPDAVSGFRALSRNAALQVNIVSGFSYTIEMLIQAGRKKLAIVSVPVRTNVTNRESRLFRSIPSFLTNSASTSVRIYAMYKPLKVFFIIGLSFLLLGSIPIIRFLYFYFLEGGAGHIQSLVLGGVLTTISALCFLVGLVADLIGMNRRLLEITLEKVREIELMAALNEDKKAQIRAVHRAILGNDGKKDEIP